jgi:hypothetical protein
LTGNDIITSLSCSYKLHIPQAGELTMQETDQTCSIGLDGPSSWVFDAPTVKSTPEFCSLSRHINQLRLILVISPKKNFRSIHVLLKPVHLICPFSATVPWRCQNLLKLLKRHSLEVKPDLANLVED